MASAVAHADRSHATWSASASERRWACPGSLALEALGNAPDKESHAAAWGTACHEIAEKALRFDKDCVTFIGETMQTKEHRIEVDDEIAETAQVYVDYVRAGSGGKDLLIEQKFSLNDLGTPFEAGGTGDAVILDRQAGLIEVVDLKGGRGIVVEALGNKQLRTYALGAVLANPGNWKRVKVTIVQPRAPHPDGRIRSEEFHVADLIEWTADLLEAMSLAAEAQDNLLHQKPPPQWVGSYLSAGDHCTFCKAAPTCPALQARSLKAAHAFFDDQTGAISTPPDPKTLEMPQIVRILDAADMIGNWLNAVRGYAQDMAEMGVDVTDGNSTYVLAPKRAVRKWADDHGDSSLADALAARAGRDAADFYDEPKLLSPAKVEKLLGKKGYEAVRDLVVQESSGFNLTRSDKTTRPAVVAPAKQFFQPE